MVSEKPKQWKRALLNVFIAFHLVAFAVWGMPSGAFRAQITALYATYFYKGGLWHSWNMFAPKPLSTNIDVQATVKYSDGSKATWIAPRMEELQGFDRLGKERFRKWRERIKSDAHSIIWDDAARWIAREMNTKPGNPPVEVKMTRYWKDVPKPRARDFQPLPVVYAKTNSSTYATVAIRPMDL